MLGILHTGITVSNMDRSIEFYRDVLGMELMGPPSEPWSGDEVSQAVGVKGAIGREAILEINGAGIELIEYAAPPSPIDTPMPPNALGSQHVAFRVADIDAKMKELEAKGVEFLSKPVLEDIEATMQGMRWVYFRDPDGILLELVQTD